MPVLVLAACALVAPSFGAAAEPPPVDPVIGGGTLRVIGGELAPPGQWPSLVALVREGTSSPADRQFCGGTVIAPRWVLTAAHCLYDIFNRQIEPSDLRVIAGVTDLRAESPREESIVTTLYVHPAYDHEAQNAYDDIALIELANEIDAPAIALHSSDPEALGEGPGFAAGWGAIEFLSPRRATYTDAVHQATVPLVSRETCNGPLSYAGYVGPGQLCAGFAEGGVDTCIGDSGGPLVVVTEEGIEQLGVVSYGRGCAEPNFYGIYTSVPAYRSWIAEFVALPEPVEPVAVLEQSRGPSTTSPSSPVAEAPVARPGEEASDNPFEPISTASDDVSSSFGGGSGGGAAGSLGLLALLGAFGARTRRRRGA